jgi:hypothetical protein
MGPATILAYLGALQLFLSHLTDLFEVNVIRFVNFYMDYASREKLARPNALLRSWHPVAILIAVPVVHSVVTVLFP